MKVEVKVPEAGESITEGVIVEWFKEDGDLVEVDEPLFELETDKVTMAVQATAAGRVSIRVGADEKVSIGQVVAVIETEAEGDGAPAPAEEEEEDAAPAEETEEGEAAPAEEEEEEEDAAPVEEEEEDADGGPPLSAPAGVPQAREKLARREPPKETATKAALDELSPAVRRLVVEHDLDPAGIEGTGRDGRLTKEDVVRHLDERGAEEAPAEEAAARRPAPKAAKAKEKAKEKDAAPAPGRARPKADAGEAPRPEGEKRQTRRPMSPLRSRIAERLVDAQQTAAILTTFNEADMSAVLALRKKWKDPFEQRHGVRLGMMSFFVKAVVDALRAVPQLNAQLEGDEVVYNHFYDIGVAVGTEKGLVVPVVRDADRLSFAGVEEAIGALAKKARDRKLTLADLTGGVFTISNGGVYGSLLSTPILNPPQSGILGLHAIKKRPVAVPDGQGGDTIEIRPMMYLAMSYDHRLVDGKEAVTFLKRIVECVENPERLLIDV